MGGGEWSNEKKIHLVNWDILTKPKRMEGVRLRKASLMNHALLSKLAWRVLSDKDAIGCKIVREKYLRFNKGEATVAEKQKTNKIWKGTV